MTKRITAVALAAAFAVAAISVDVYHDMTNPRQTTAVIVHADATNNGPDVYHDM